MTQLCQYPPGYIYPFIADVSIRGAFYISGEQVNIAFRFQVSDKPPQRVSVSSRSPTRFSTQLVRGCFLQHENALNYINGAFGDRQSPEIESL